VEVFFSNPDLLWAASFPHPRLGQGAFAAALQALHHRITGRPLPRVRSFGKPNPEPYRCARPQMCHPVCSSAPPPNALLWGVRATSNYEDTSHRCGVHM
jgi:hypothetical protein